MNVFVLETWNNCFCSGLNVRNPLCFKELVLISESSKSKSGLKRRLTCVTSVKQQSGPVCWAKRWQRGKDNQLTNWGLERARGRGGFWVKGWSAKVRRWLRSQSWKMSVRSSLNPWIMRATRERPLHWGNCAFGASSQWWQPFGPLFMKANEDNSIRFPSDSRSLLSSRSVQAGGSQLSL